MHRVAYGKVLAAFSATSCEHATAVLGGHAAAETMLVETAMVVGLESHFHNLVLLLFILLFIFESERFLSKRGCKNRENN
jgi:hypothetical protein